MKWANKDYYIAALPVKIAAQVKINKQNCYSKSQVVILWEMWSIFHLCVRECVCVFAEKSGYDIYIVSIKRNTIFTASSVSFVSVLPVDAL